MQLQERNQRAIFIDRDGTIIKAVPRKDFPYPTAPWLLKELRYYRHVNKALKLFKEMGFLRIMITNQPDVAYGYVTRKKWEKIHKRVLDKFDFDDAFVCPHPKGKNCGCRKPKCGLLRAAAFQHNVDLSNSWMIGDMNVDLAAGESAGCRSILLNRGYNNGMHKKFTMPNLWRAAQFIQRIKHYAQT